VAGSAGQKQSNAREAGTVPLGEVVHSYSDRRTLWGGGQWLLLVMAGDDKGSERARGEYSGKKKQGRQRGAREGGERE